MLIIKTPIIAAKEVEKRGKYRFWDKERERSNRAALLHRAPRPPARSCPRQHNVLAWSGPPHDAIQAFVCLDCKAAACEPEIKDRGYDFWECPDYILDEILDLDLQRQAQGNIISYPIRG